MATGQGQGQRALHEVLRERRLRLEISQRELAKLLGKEQSWVARVELGETRVPADFMPAYADALGVSVGHIYRQMLVPSTRVLAAAS